MPSPHSDPHSALTLGVRAPRAFCERRWRRVELAWVVAVLALAAVWRFVLAAAMPCISKDGTLYIEYARWLAADGLEALRRPEFAQHPLYAALVLVAHQAAVAFGAVSSPMLWQRAGQAVALLSGLAVVGLCGGLTARVAAALRLDVDVPRVTLLALLLAALLPLNTWLSADVISDQLHAAWYLAAVLAAWSLPARGAALATGLLSGAAFLTRPEGATVALAAGLSLWLRPREGGLRRAIVCAALLTGGFVIVAGPYWAALGGLTPKLNKETVAAFREAAAARRDAAGVEPQRAALVRRDVSWPAAPLRAGYELLRAGRVIVPLLAGVFLLRVGSRWRERALFVPLACVAIHFGLVNLLLVRHGYLDPRHLLPVVLLAIPAAAIGLMWLVAWCGTRRRLAGALVAATLLPLALYSTRVPNGADRDVSAAGAWLARHAGLRASDVLLGGASERRIAFYAGIGWRGWPENAPAAERLGLLRAHLLGDRPEYFAIELGRGDELAGNAALLEALRQDEQVGPRLRLLHEEPGDPEGAVLVFALDWGGQ